MFYAEGAVICQSFQTDSPQVLEKTKGKEMQNKCPHGQVIATSMLSTEML